VAGDLFVHLLTGIHHATGALGPTRIAAMGGRRYWDDGREVYDLIMGLLDYPETKAHPAFTLALQTDFQDGGGDNSLFRFVGSDGVIDVTFKGFKVTRVGIAKETPQQVLKGYNSVVTFSKAQQEAYAAHLAKVGIAAALSASSGDGSPRRAGPTSFQAPSGYDERYDHFVNFFRAVREGTSVEEDATFGYRAAAPALLCNDSYRKGTVIGWDPAAMQIVS
jgi:hypothetical protein